MYFLACHDLANQRIRTATYPKACARRPTAARYVVRKFAIAPVARRKPCMADACMVRAQSVSAHCLAMNLVILGRRKAPAPQARTSGDAASKSQRVGH